MFDPIALLPGSTPRVRLAFDALNRTPNLIDGVGTTRWTYHPNGMVMTKLFDDSGRLQGNDLRDHLDWLLNQHSETFNEDQIS